MSEDIWESLSIITTTLAIVVFAAIGKTDLVLTFGFLHLGAHLSRIFRVMEAKKCGK